MKIRILFTLFILSLLSSIKGEDYKSFISNLNLNLEEISVVTEDRYILSIWEVTSKDKNNRNGKSIVLQHGLIDGAFTWFILEQKSLAKLLCDEGYKVYLPNVRGTKFSKSHLDYDVSVNSEFWDFSLDQIAQYDLTAIISLIKERDNVEKIDYIGHSQGTLTFFLNYMSNPDFLENSINHFIGLGTVANLNNATHFILNTLKTTNLLNLIPIKNFWSFPPEIGQVLVPFCQGIAKSLCQSLLKIAFGGLSVDTGRVDYDRLGKNIFLFEPGGTSIQNVKHWIQIYSAKKLIKYDYGSKSKNKEHYGTENPPEYDLSKMKNYSIKSIVTISDSDPFCNPNDTLDFLKNIEDQSVVEVMSLTNYDHIDYLWSDSAYDEIYPKILNCLVQKFYILNLLFINFR